jgi:LCP family protein required for cell wall assembly
LVFWASIDKTNLLVLGLDSREANSDLARSDTIILTTYTPKTPYLRLLSVPRDLWVSIPGYGSNRINTAHFFAESDLAGSGPYVAMQTIRQNFNVEIDYYIRIRFSGFLDLIDAIGGVVVNLPVPMSGLPAGPNHLNAEKALAFVRDRTGSDDFFRMQRTQIFLIGLWKRMLDPGIIRQLPDIIPIIVDVIDTDMPLIKWVHLGFTMLRIGPDKIDARVITRDMTIPFTTQGGAQVLEPDWDRISPILLDMFEE